MMRLILLLSIVFLSCNVKVKHPHCAVFSTVGALMRDDTTRTGFFTNVSLFDKKYEEIEYTTAQGSVFVPNDGTQNCLICRYDTVTLKPIWINVAGGSGGDGGVNYYTVPPENAVYVVGYFEGTAYFPKAPGSPWCDTLVSYGMADMFIAKYSYDKGVLQWVRSGGSAYSDVVFTYNGARHTETYMTVDSIAVTVYANFFGRSTFDGKFIDAKTSGAAVAISYDKKNGEVKDVRFVTELPAITKQK